MLLPRLDIKSVELEVRILWKVDKDAPQIDIDIVQDLGKASLCEEQPSIRDNDMQQRGHFE